MNSNDQDKGTPISVVIRNRLKEARKRFHANDNISQYIEPGELGQLLDEVEQKMKGVLESLVIDTVSDHKRYCTTCRQNVFTRSVWWAVCRSAQNH